MKAFAKLIGLVVFGVILLGVGVLFFLTRLFDPNDYKDDIQQAARDKANIELTLAGDIGWSLFPWLGIELKDVSIAPLDTPDQPLAEVGSLGLGVEVLPLLRRQLRMSDVILDSVSLNLVRDAEGAGNWENLGARDETVASAEDAEPAPDQPDSSAELDFAIDSFSLTNARISYEDQASGQRYLVEDANLKTGALIEGQAVDVAFLGLLSSEQPVMRVRIDLSAVAQFDLDLKRYQLNAINLNVDASGEPLAGRALSLQLQGDSLLDLTAQVAEFSEMRLSIADLRATGQIRASQLDQDMVLSGRLDVAEFNARELLASLGQAVPETANPRALEKLALSGDISGSASSLMLEKLRLVLDGAELVGSLGLADFERQALRFELTGNRLNLDDYLPPPAEEASAASSVPSGGSTSDSPPPEWSDEPVLPLELMSALDVDGTLELQEVVLTGQTISNFKTALNARNGRIRLTRFEGGMFGGRFNATADIDTRRTPVSVSANKQLTGVDALAVQQAYDMAEQMRGRLDFNLDVRASGNSMRSWMSSLNGSANFNVADGALLGTNLEQKVCQAIALANRKTLAEPRGAENTPFQSLGGSFRITDGKIVNNDLVAALPGIALKGRGEVNLPIQRMDYRLGLVLQGDKTEMPDPACEVNPRYANIEWPVRCQGFLHNAASSCGVDTEGVGRIAAQLLGNEAQRKVEEAIQDRLGDQAPEVRDAIRGLFNR
ncbi:MAG: AsmA family protein [Gammaproteobacteria bacterium HGW-Gammaproteobacteria-11]|nr:MAG: AsmA family protein [Gammaproteobacteria bacterium HGW-Gammaproteobacteria-11]